LQLQKRKHFIKPCTVVEVIIIHDSNACSTTPMTIGRSENLVGQTPMQSLLIKQALLLIQSNLMGRGEGAKWPPAPSFRSSDGPAPRLGIFTRATISYNRSWVMTPVASYGSEPSESQKNCSDYLIIIESNLIKKFFSISAKNQNMGPLAPKVPPVLHTKTKCR
jgi:hypothetical protein